MLRAMRTASLAILCLFVVFTASSTFAQYQLRKPTTPTQQKASITVTDPAGGATWEKGKRYAIKWKSEGRVPSVKIVLIDQVNKSHDIVRSTTNSGLYNYTVSTRLADGAYKVVVMTADGSVKGEAGGTVTIQKKTFGTQTAKALPPAGGGTAEQPESPAIAERSLPARTLPSGLAGQTVTQQGGVQPGDLTATKDEDKDSPGLADFQVGGTTVGGFATELSDATISVAVGNLPTTQVSAADAAQLDASLLQPVEEPEPSGSGSHGSITFLEPQQDDVWAPGQQYQISWAGPGISGPIHLILKCNTVDERRIVTTGASASGSFLYTVPSNMRLARNFYSLLACNEDSTLLQTVWQISVWEPQAVDLKCVITHASPWRFSPSGSRDFDFDIAVINDGTSGPLTVPILVRLIKQPENVVIYQMQAGFGDVFPGSWYMTNGQIHWDVRELEENYTSGGRSGIDFDSGHYILEVNADVGNSLGEREELLFDNIDTKQVNVMD